MTITGILFSLFFMSLYLFEKRSYKIVLKTATEQQELAVKSLIKISNRLLNQITWDYTYWDEFITAIKGGQKDWYLINITTIISSFHMDYVCVYDKDFNIVHEASSETISIRNIIPRTLFAKIKDSTTGSFYLNTKEGVFDVSWASIHPTYDSTHKATASSGYLFVAKNWSKEFFEELSILSGTNIKELSPSDSIVSQNETSVNTNILLSGWDSSPVARIFFTREHKGLTVYKKTSIFLLAIILFSFFFIWLTFNFVLKKWVLKPLKLVISIIGNDDLDHINDLKKTTWEFRQIGLLFESHIKQRKELIQAKVKAEESDKLKSSFLANMSHEIRTPMNSILGFAGLLKESDLSRDQQLKFIRIIEVSGTRMLNLMNDLVNISKIEAGHLEANISQFNLNELLDYIYSFFKPEVERKGLKFIMDKRLATTNATVKSDREKLYVIVSNLIKNAIKYTHSGYIKFGFDLIDNVLTFFVHDTGIGISKDNQEFIFNRFIQADTSLSKEYEGAGLGLAITKAYIEILGGKIWVESESGKGSSFYFTLPCEFVSMPDSLSANLNIFNYECKNAPKPKILIAEDESSSAILLCQILKNVSDNIILAVNGAEAVELFRQNRDTDIILMDIKMPLMDGFEATRQIRAIDKSVVIIAQTAYALASEKEMAIKTGCNDHISKPIVKKDLIALIKKYFSLKN